MVIFQMVFWGILESVMGRAFQLCGLCGQPRFQRVLEQAIQGQQLCSPALLSGYSLGFLPTKCAKLASRYRIRDMLYMSFANVGIHFLYFPPWQCELTNSASFNIKTSRCCKISMNRWINVDEWLSPGMPGRSFCDRPTVLALA